MLQSNENPNARVIIYLAEDSKLYLGAHVQLSDILTFIVEGAGLEIWNPHTALGLYVDGAHD